VASIVENWCQALASYHECSKTKSLKAANDRVIPRDAKLCSDVNLEG
jgi:hypothetical protein